MIETFLRRDGYLPKGTAEEQLAGYTRYRNKRKHQRLSDGYHGMFERTSRGMLGTTTKLFLHPDTVWPSNCVILDFNND